MSILILPNELLDRIVDFNHDDKETLLTCSLLCSRFLPSSRYHLFNSFTIRMTRYYNDEDDPPELSFAEPYVETLNIDWDYFRPDFFEFLPPAFMPTAKPSCIMHRNFIRNNFDEGSYSLIDACRAIGHTSSVTHLKFSICKLDSIDELTSALSFYPILESITCHRVFFRLYDPPISQLDYPIFSRLRILRIVSMEYDIFDWFLNQKVASPVEKFITSCDKSLPLHRVITHFRSTLNFVEILPSGWDGDGKHSLNSRLTVL